MLKIKIALLVLGASLLGAITLFPVPVFATAVSVTDTNVQWSPYGWIASGSTYKQSPIVGSYIDVAFSGTTLALNVDNSFFAPATPANLIVSAYIDGSSTPINRSMATISGGQISFTTGLAPGNHYAHIVISQNTNFSTRWAAVSGTPRSTLRITSLQLETGASVLPVSTTPLVKTGPQMLYYGDSITEGGNIGTGGAPGGVSHASIVGEELGALYGIHGFASQAWYFSILSSTAEFYEPTGVNYGNAVWNNYYQGTSFLNNPTSPSSGYAEGGPDAVFNNLGINDVAVYGVGPPFGGATALAQFESKIQAWLADTRQAIGPYAPIFMVVPFNYYCTTANNPSTTTDQQNRYALYLPAYYNSINQHKATNNDGRVYIIDLGATGCETVVANSDDDLHPNATGARLLGEMIAAQAQPIIYTSLAAQFNSAPLLTGTAISDPTPTLTGTGIPGSTINVALSGHTCSTVVDVSGNWSCSFTAALSNGSYNFSVTETTPWGEVFSLGPFGVTVSAQLVETGNETYALQAGAALLLISVFGKLWAFKEH